MSISWPCSAAVAYNTNAPTPGPMSSTTVPGSDAARLWSTSHGRVAVAVVRDAQVREHGQERRVDLLRRIDTLGNDVGRAVRREVLVDQREGRTGDRAQLDGDHVILGPAPVREPGQVAAEHAEDVRA